MFKKIQKEKTFFYALLFLKKKNDLVLNALIRKTQIRLIDANKKINQLANEVSELLSSLKGDSKVDGELSNRITNLRKKISEINNIAND